MNSTKAKNIILDILGKKYNIHDFLLRYENEDIYKKNREERTEEEKEKIIQVGQASYYLDYLTEEVNKLIPMLDDSEELKKVFINLNKIEICEYYIKAYQNDILSFYTENIRAILKDRNTLKKIPK